MEKWEFLTELIRNTAYFGARYLSGGSVGIRLSFRAEASVMRGLEVEIDTLKQREGAEVFVPLAAVRTEHSGEAIYKLCERNEDRTEKGGLGSMLYDAKWPWGRHRGYCIQRWNFWKEGFHEVAKGRHFGLS